MGIFGGSNRATRLQIIQQEKAAAEARAQAQQALEQQKKLHEENKKLQKEQLKFQKQQAAEAAKRDAELKKLAERPPPAPPPPPAAIAIGDDAGTVGTGGAEEQASVDSRRKGRSALRIDLNAPQVAGNTGLNVPRG